MSILVSIDPGQNNIGVAAWIDGTLINAKSFSPDSLRNGVGWVSGAFGVRTWLQGHLLLSPPDEIAYEQPQILSSWTEGSGDDILQVSGAAGAVVACLASWYAESHRGCAPEIHAVYPANTRKARGWTGGRKKPPNHLRMLRRLRPAEVDLLCALSDVSTKETLRQIMLHGDAAKLEHMFDAVCIGLYHLDRWDI